MRRIDPQVENNDQLKASQRQYDICYLRINAPHIKCSVVMPGQIGTSIRANTRKIHSGDRESDAIDAAV